MSGYGFGKKTVAKSEPDAGAIEDQKIDFSGIERSSVSVDPVREEVAIERGEARGFVNRGEGQGAPEPVTRRRRPPPQPQINVFIKGPKDTLDWFVEYSNSQGHRAYWETIAEFRALVEGNKK